LFFFRIADQVNQTERPVQQPTRATSAHFFRAQHKRIQNRRRHHANANQSNTNDFASLFEPSASSDTQSALFTTTPSSVADQTTESAPVLSHSQRSRNKRARVTNRHHSIIVAAPTLDQSTSSGVPDGANAARKARRSSIAGSATTIVVNANDASSVANASMNQPTNNTSGPESVTGERETRRRSSRLTSKPAISMSSNSTAAASGAQTNTAANSDLPHPPPVQTKQHSFFRKYRRSHAHQNSAQADEHAYQKSKSSSSSAQHSLQSASAALSGLVSSGLNAAASNSGVNQLVGLDAFTGSAGAAIRSTSSLLNPYAMPSSSSYSSNASANGSATGGSSSESAATDGAETDEIGRLQALLESKGLPPHLFGALGPRVQHLLHRSIGNGNCSRAAQLLPALQLVGDEGQQLQAVMEMCQLLVMGNEDTLAGFPIKQTVPALVQLMGMEHNFDIMNHACRALTYMMESLPRSCPVVVDAVPVFLEKLQVIQCMDVAEQSLSALEMLSRRHAKAILHHKGVHACLMYLDFFSTNAQRAALQITANCCANLTNDEFVYVRESISTLSTHLNNQDRKCVESVCLAFARLVDAFHSDADILQQISGNNLFANIQQLLLATPSLISSTTFVMVLRMLAAMCAASGKLAVELLKLNIHQTIRYLLVGSKTARTSIGGADGNTSRASNADDTEVELTTRSAQELYEITSLIAELMPHLPTDGLFAVEQMLYKSSSDQQHVQWQWRDERGSWHNYGSADGRMLESAHSSGEEEVTLSSAGRTYVIDLQGMQQINEETGNTRQIQRKVTALNSNSNSLLANSNDASTSKSPSSSGVKIESLDGKKANKSVDLDARVQLLKERPELLEEFMRCLFTLVYEIYNSSAAPSVRNKCVRALLRIIFHAPPELLSQELKYSVVSSQLAAMLPSTDLRIVVGAVEMAHVLMDKLGDIFSLHFVREGVLHQFTQIINSAHLEEQQNAALKSLKASKSVQMEAAVAKAATSAGAAVASNGLAQPAQLIGYWTHTAAGASPNQAPVVALRNDDASGIAIPATASNNPPHQRLTDALKRKRNSKKSSNKLLGSSNSLVTGSGHSSSRKSKNESVDRFAANALPCDVLASGSTSAIDPLQTQYFSMPFFSMAENAAQTGAISDVQQTLNAASQPSTSTGTTMPTDSSLLANSVNSATAAIQLLPSGSQSNVFNTQLIQTSSQLTTATNTVAGNVSVSVQQQQQQQHLLNVNLGRGRPSFKLSSAASKTSSFFASLHPSRWGRWTSTSGTPNSGGPGQNNLLEGQHVSGSRGVLHRASSSGSAGAATLLDSANLSSSTRGVLHRASSAVGSALLMSSSDPTAVISHSYPALASPRVHACNREKIRQWIHSQSISFVEKYFPCNEAGISVESHPALETLSKLTQALKMLELNEPHVALSIIRDLLLGGDISSFELIYSGFVQKMTQFLTEQLPEVDSQSTDSAPPAMLTMPRNQRICLFLHIFAGAPEKPDSWLGNTTHLPPDLRSEAFYSLVNKLNACVSHLEQFPVRVHDVLGSNSGSSVQSVVRNLTSVLNSSNNSVSHYLKLFAANQLKCQLQRHKDARTLRQWNGGVVKVDPHALVQTIERYLLTRGFGKAQTSVNAPSSDHDDDDDEDESEHDLSDDQQTNALLAQASNQHSLQLLYNDHVLPYNLTVYQAIRQFAYPDTEQSSDPELMASIWSQTHTIQYRLCTDATSIESASNSSQITNSDQPTNSESSASTKRSSRHGAKTSGSTSGSRRKDELWLEGKVPASIASSVLDHLTAKLPATLTAQLTNGDPSLDVINLLRVLFLLNQNWGFFYQLPCAYQPPLTQNDFVNNKLAAKANRQLQDPFMIFTCKLPHWLPQLAYSCPFLFPFQCRHLLFYVACFDRDRALQRLQDNTPGGLSGSAAAVAALAAANVSASGSNSEAAERMTTPRLERRKRTITREDVLKQAETVLNELAGSRSLLEIRYENEVGTGLGPTLEFYALVSKELQRADLDLWRGEITEPNGDQTSYVFAKNGLFPAPLGRSAKSHHVSKIKSRYRLLGKFMAKALYDSRMVSLLFCFIKRKISFFINFLNFFLLKVDIPMSIPFYKWLLGQQSSLSMADLTHIDETVARTICNLEAVARKKQRLDSSSKSGQDSEANELTLDGVPIEDLDLDFTLPGFSSVELRKGGKDLSVTLRNLSEYVRLLTYWTLNEGVLKQMEAFKEGFECVFPLNHLRLFYANELEQLFCGSGFVRWELSTLMDCCHPDHGYNLDSRAIKFLFEILCSYDVADQRSFLQFVTGSPRLPVGGLKSLSPPLTIVRKTFEPGEQVDDYLPSVMTCVNYLKLPDYSTIEVMRRKLLTAANEGQNSFHLS
jgi:E3 ubiquitin-protein ligase TRIP12